jgi:parallel beta-helix repeat protein
MNARMLPKDKRRLAYQYFNVISLEKASTFPWERKIERKIIMEEVSASSVGVKASLILNSDNGKRYSTLQEAINDPETKDGHTLIVEPGIHIGGVIVNKSLTIRSSSSRPEETVVTIEWADEDVFTVFTDNVKISGFTIRGGFNGILLEGVKNCVVSKNIIFGSRHAGIQLSNSVNNLISENLIHSNTGDFGQGIRLYESNSNTIMMNNIIKNRYGILIGSSDNNMLYLNNFNNVKKNVSSHNSKNNWNSPAEIEYAREGRLLRKPLGNHWSDYNGKDFDGDGIGDTPYSIREENNDEDRYPLPEPFEKYASKEAELLRQLNTSNIATEL